MEEAEKYTEHIFDLVKALRFWFILAAISDERERSAIDGDLANAAEVIAHQMEALCRLADVNISAKTWFDLIWSSMSGEEAQNSDKKGT